MQSNFLKANCFDVWTKEEGVYPLLSPPPYSLILQWIFKYYCDLFMAARCSASLSYFQVDIFTGRRVGRYIDLYMGGIMLEFVTALSSVPPRASFCCCLKSLMTFSGSSPQGCKIHSWPGFINHPVHFTQDVIGSAARGRVATCWLFFMLLCIASLWNQLPFNSVKPLQALMQLKAF